MRSQHIYIQILRIIDNRQFLRWKKKFQEFYIFSTLKRIFIIYTDSSGFPAQRRDVLYRFLPAFTLKKTSSQIIFNLISIYVHIRIMILISTQNNLIYCFLG